MPKTSKGGASNGTSVVVANPDQVVTIGHLAALLNQLGLPLTLTGTAGYGAPSEPAASATVLLKANNLSDVTAASARTNLGLGTAATQATTAFLQPDVAATGKVLVSAGLGVGNSAAATTLGNVAKKIQVFDSAGVSLGYLPVYDAIT